MAKSSNRAEALKNFTRDTAEHRVEIVRDDGAHRHLRCRKPGTGIYGFDIVTWPGYLAITGDMGSGLFTRLSDMFEFFRQAGDGPLKINASYWHEKLAADCRMSSSKQYDPDLFRQRVIERYRDWRRSSGEKHHSHELRKLREEIRGEVLWYADHGEQRAYQAAYEFEFNGRQFFSDFSECNLTDYTVHFLWRCYAIVWAIRQYDAMKEAAHG